MEPTPTRTERPALWRKGPPVRLGAMVGAILLVAAACGGDGESATTQDATSTTTSVATTTTVPSTTTTVAAVSSENSSTTTTVAAISSEDALAVVFAAIEARNRGDIDTYKTSLTGEELGFEVNVHLAEAFTYANATTELSDCRVTANTPRGSVVKCESISTDDFYGAGGIVDSGTVTFLVTEDLKISGSGNEGDDIPWEETEKAMFNLAFHSWLLDAHPSVFDDIVAFPGELGNIPGLNFGVNHQPAEMGIAVQYVGEFVAQSDVYPINS